LSRSFGIAFGPDGRMLVSDSGNHKLKLLKHSPAGWQVESVADPGQLVKGPLGITYSHVLNAFLVCCLGSHKIVKVQTHNSVEYTIQPFAGNGQDGQQDGTVDDAMFSHPQHITCDGAGNILVSDQDATTLRHISNSGVVTSVEVDAPGGYDLALCCAQPIVTRTGDLLVADADNAMIHVLDHGNAFIYNTPRSGVLQTEASVFESNLWEQQQSGMYCDIIFRVDGGDISAHRNVLAASSEYFATRFSTAVGAQDPVITITNTTPSTFRALLKWLYTHQLEVEDGCSTTDVLLLARQYMVHDLEAECTTRLEESLKESMSSAVRLFVWGAQHLVDGIREKAKSAMLSFSKSGQRLSDLPAGDVSMLEKQPKLMFELMSSMSNALNRPQV
jgi:hypothetical protein